jgi:HEPN domain-containing protein
MTQPDKDVVWELVEQWLHKADQDLQAAKALLGNQVKLPYPSSFHSQQAAEKYLKALLTWRQVEFPPTHSIRKLLNLVEQNEPALPEELDESAKLTVYGVQARYPGNLPDPDINEAEEALRLAKRVRQAVLSRLQST